MPRGAEQSAINLSNTNNQNASNFNNEGQQDYGAVNRFYTGEMTNPQGFTQQQLANQLTGSNQTLGGSNAGVAGTGALMAARQGNSAGLATALDNSSRNNAKLASQNAVGIQNQNAMLQQKQQQAGAAGVNSLYNTNISSGLKSLGLSDQDVNTWINGAQATNATWMQPLDAAISGGSQVGAAAVKG